MSNTERFLGYSAAISLVLIVGSALVPGLDGLPPNTAEASAAEVAGYVSASSVDAASVVSLFVIFGFLFLLPFGAFVSERFGRDAATAGLGRTAGYGLATVAVFGLAAAGAFILMFATGAASDETVRVFSDLHVVLVALSVAATLPVTIPLALALARVDVIGRWATVSGWVVAALTVVAAGVPPLIDIAGPVWSLWLAAVGVALVRADVPATAAGPAVAAG